jgi:hypothetical protein
VFSCGTPIAKRYCAKQVFSHVSRGKFYCILGNIKGVNSTYSDNLDDRIRDRFAAMMSRQFHPWVGGGVNPFYTFTLVASSFVCILAYMRLALSPLAPSSLQSAPITVAIATTMGVRASP